MITQWNCFPRWFKIDWCPIWQSFPNWFYSHFPNSPQETYVSNPGSHLSFRLTPSSASLSVKDVSCSYSKAKISQTVPIVFFPSVSPTAFVFHHGLCSATTLKLINQKPLPQFPLSSFIPKNNNLAIMTWYF